MAVFGWMRKQGQLELCLVLPDGSKSLIPAAWTDIDSGAEPAAGAGTLGSLADLLHARAVVDGLIHRAERGGRRRMRGSQPRRSRMQQTLPLDGLTSSAAAGAGSGSLPASRPRRCRCWPG